MLYHLITFNDGCSIRAKSIKVNSPHSFDITTDKDETLLMHYKRIMNIVPTTKSWKSLKLNGIKKASIS
jgi:hypothetical protein